MTTESFFSKYRFTIILVSIIFLAATWSLYISSPEIEGVPRLNPILVMLLALVGLAAGCLGGWIGTGGCSVMLPILHFWLGFSAPMAVGTTLFAVIFTALSGGYGHFKQKNVHSRTALWLGSTGIAGVLLGSWLFLYLSQHSNLLGFILGVVFLWPAIRMIREGIAKGIPGAVVQGNVINAAPAGLAGFGGIVGILTGLVGLGGGYALVPGLIYLFGSPVYITMGTSLAVMLPLALVGGVIKLAQGYVALSAALTMATGTIIGAQVGAATIKKFKPSTLKLIFGIYFLYVAVKFIGNYLGVHIW